MSDSFALSFFGIAVIAVAVLAAFSVRPRWRLAGLLFATVIWAIGTGLRGELPWPSAFETRWLCLVAAGLLAIATKRFVLIFPAVLMLWILGAWGELAVSSFGDAVRYLHRLGVVALAGVGLAAFSRLVALAWNGEQAGSAGTADARPRDPRVQDAGWKTVSIAAGLLLVIVFLTLVFELTYPEQPLGLQAPLGLLLALAEAISGICLWRATVQASQFELRRPDRRQNAVPVRWQTMLGLMLVFLLTGLAFAMVPVIAAAA